MIICFSSHLMLQWSPINWRRCFCLTPSKDTGIEKFFGFCSFTCPLPKPSHIFSHLHMGGNRCYYLEWIVHLDLWNGGCVLNIFCAGMIWPLVHISDVIPTCSQYSDTYDTDSWITWIPKASYSNSFNCSLKWDTFYSIKINPSWAYTSNILNIIYCSLGPFLKSTFDDFR